MLQAQPRLSAVQHQFQDLRNKKQSTNINQISSLFFSQQSAIMQNNNLYIPIYKGHFVNYHYEPMQLDDSITISGIQDGFAFFVVNETFIQFHFFTPLQDDLNYYYNTDDRKYKFPIRVKDQQIPHIDHISAVGFQQTEDIWTMAVASEFSISLFTFTGDLDNFQMLKKGFKVNGEYINQIIFFQESLIFGGSSGMLTCKSIDTAQSYSMQLKEKIKKQLSRIFKDLAPWTANWGLVQLEVSEEFNLCFGLFEKCDANQNIDDTSIKIYDLGLCGECFTEILTIRQSQLYHSSLELKNMFEFQNLQFYHVHFEKQHQTNRLILIITTKEQLQIYLLFDQQDRTQEEINAFKSRIQNSQKESSTTSYTRIRPEFQLLQVRYPQMKIDEEIPYGICLDESRMQYKQKEMLALQTSQTLKCVHKEQQLSLYHIDNYIFAQFVDMAHLQFLRSLDQQISKLHSYTQLQQSVYRDTSQEAVEKIDLHGNNEFNVPKNIYQIGRMTVHRLFNHSDINESQLYNHPEHYVCIADNTIEFIVRMRPIDCFFTAIKVTHFDFIDQIDPEFPLEKLVRAFGIEESCSQILQLIIQEDCLFYTNVELQHQYQLDLQKAYQRIHHSEYISKFFDDNEKIPQWVTGQIYVRKGSIIKDKALKAYFQLVKRTLLSEDRNSKSKKVASTTALIWKILAPLTTKKFINEQVYNLECNKPIESYSTQQLQVVFKQIDKLIKLFENEPNFYSKLKNQKNDALIDEQNQNQNYKKGFSKYLYETFEQSTRLDMTRCTNTMDQSLVVSINVDVEHTQMKGLYNYCLQIQQLIGFLIYFFGELQGIRNIINSYQNKQQLFDLSVKSILSGDSVGILTLKQLMIHIIKSDKSKFRDTAHYMYIHFPEFFTMQDFKISLAQNSFDEILNFAAQKNLIKLNPNASHHEKIKRILKLSKAPQITIDKVLEKMEIFIYFKELQPELQDQLKEALKSIEEVVNQVSHTYLSQSFLNYMYPFATFKYFLQFLAQKSKQLEKDEQEVEYQNCFLLLISQFNLLISYYQNPPKGLTQLQTREILIESLQVLNQFQFTKAMEVVANNLYKQQMQEFIQFIEYNQDLDIQCSELEKLQMQKKQLVAKAVKGNYDVVLQAIQLLLKLAQFSLAQNPEMSLEDIQQKLSIKKRLRYVFKAQEFIRIYQKNTQGVDISEIEKLAQILSKELFFQDIMYDYVVTNEDGNYTYSSEKRRILIDLIDCKIQMQFFEDNHIYFAKILSMDYLEQKQHQSLYSNYQIDQQWIEFISSSYFDHEEFPSDIFKAQLKLVFENLINSQRYIRISSMITTIELINTKQCEEKHETQVSTWFFLEMLLNNDIKESQLAQVYVDQYLQNYDIQNNQLYQKLEIEQLKTYRIQLIQQILILFDVMKKKKSDQRELAQLIIQFRNEFENEYRDLVEDQLYDKDIIQEIKERVDSL